MQQITQIQKRDLNKFSVFTQYRINTNLAFVYLRCISRIKCSFSIKIEAVNLCLIQNLFWNVDISTDDYN